MLESFEVDENLTAAAKLMGKSAEFFEIKKTEWRNGVKKFLVAVSEPTDDPMTATFKKVDHSTLDELYPKIFTAKDAQILEGLYRDFHEVSSDDLEAIVGKALPVSSED